MLAAGTIPEGAGQNRPRFRYPGQPAFLPTDCASERNPAGARRGRLANNYLPTLAHWPGSLARRIRALSVSIDAIGERLPGRDSRHSHNRARLAWLCLLICLALCIKAGSQAGRRIPGAEDCGGGMIEHAQGYCNARASNLTPTEPPTLPLPGPLPGPPVTLFVTPKTAIYHDSRLSYRNPYRLSGDTFRHPKVTLCGTPNRDISRLPTDCACLHTYPRAGSVFVTITEG